MKELKLSKGVVKVIWDEKEYLLRKPTLGRALELEKQIEGATEKSLSSLAGVIDFIVESGLPKEVVLEFDVESLEAVIQVLMPSKKK